MYHFNASSYYRKHLIDPEARLWSGLFTVDPTQDPLSDRLVSALFDLGSEDLEIFVSAGIIWKTCRSSALGDSPKFYSNYWDIVQASVTFSLLAVHVPLSSAVDLAIEICDRISIFYDTQLTNEGAQLSDVISLIECDLNQCAPLSLSAFSEYGNENISAKVAVDLLNTHTRFKHFLESIKRSEGNSGSVSIMIGKVN